jgi:hypothetical protein
MKCRDCRFISDPEEIRPDQYPSVRCTLGLWDKPDRYDPARKVTQWYAYGEMILNRGPVRRYGEACTRGEPKKKGGL